jgi:predicted ATPase
MGMMLRGWALAEQGQEEAGIAAMRQGLAAWRASGAELAVPYWSAMLVEGYGKSGQADEGRRVIDEVLATVDTTGQRFFSAELYRLKGELLVRQATGRRVGEVEPAVLSAAATCFRQARGVAGEQQARWLELRAVTNLSRVALQQHQRAEARQVLEATARWFTEGEDLVDLQAARALLAEVS